MPASGRDNEELLSALDRLLEKYFTKRCSESARQIPIDTFWETYLEAARDEDEARPKDWDGTTGSILNFVRMISPGRVSHLTPHDRQGCLLLLLQLSSSKAIDSFCRTQKTRL